MESLYLFYGQEQYLIEEALKKIKKSFNVLMNGINLIKIDENNISKLIPNIETPCFGFEKKLIVIRNSGLLKKEGKKKNAVISNLVNEIAEYIEENINNIQQDNVIVFIEEEIEKNKLYKVIEKYGKICNFEPEKLPSLIKRVKSITSLYNVKISDENAKYFIECCGTNVQDIINELRKLIEYTGNSNEIQKEYIDMLTTKQIDSVIFDLTDNLGKKNIKKAMEVFNNLIYQKEPVQKILITLYNHFKKLYMVRIAQNSNENIADALKLKPNQTFLVTKYKTQSGYFKENELRSILKELSDLDYKYKIGLIDLNIGIESILCNYCN